MLISVTGTRNPGIALARSGLLVAVGLAALAAFTAPRPWFGAVALLALLYAALLSFVTRASRRLAVQASASEHAALHDPVTELPNRVLFHDRVHQAVALAARRNGNVAVLLLDLDRFKEINDTLGHHNGDLLLHTVGARVRESLRESDSVARLGGDEFAVLLADVDGPDGARLAAGRVREAVSERFELEGIGVEVEASVGIALFPEHGSDPEALLQRADVAMYAAKQAHCGLELYTEGVDAYSRDRLELIADLRRAIAQDEIVLHFQPKADLASGQVTGVEALVRWAHPERGFLYPDAFIPFAEHTGVMRPLTLHILDRALAQCRLWHDAGLELGVAVNISTRNLLDLTLPDELERLIALHGIAPEMIELEITETTIMADPPRAKVVLARLSELGVSLAVDDFGTGYTSLAWLRDLPVTTLKIDKSFVLNMGVDAGDSVIVRSTVQLGSNLGLRVVAEGVEDAAAWDELTALGCDLAQGYHLSRPQPAEVLSPWLLDRARLPAA
jgi:diguanylate cyclase (GGDEF)-like protein